MEEGGCRAPPGLLERFAGTVFVNRETAENPAEYRTTPVRVPANSLRARYVQRGKTNAGRIPRMYP